MEADRRRIVAWVGTHVMPHEPAVRAWLRRSRVPQEDIDDLIQEAYCKLAALDRIDHIVSVDGYFFQIVRNLLIEQMRRARIVRFETVIEIEAVSVCEAPSAERVTGARRELARVRQLIDALPDRCRRIFELRKIEGMSQRDIARRLRISESAVENDGVKGLRLIIQALRDEQERFTAREKAWNERSRTRQRD